MKAFELMAEAFIAEGTKEVFAIMGDGNMSWLGYMEGSDKVKVYNVRHESAGLAMADGVSRARPGEVGVASVTCGPGLTQLGTSLMVASRHRSPIVVLAGDWPLVQKGHGGLQDMPQQAFVEACGSLFQPLRSPETAQDDVRQAFYMARTHRCPVVLSASFDVQESPVELTVDYVPSLDQIPSAFALPPNAEAVDKATEMIMRSRRPLIMAGLGAAASGPRDRVVELADRIGALVSTTLPAKAYFGDYKFNLGITGGMAHATAGRMFEEADLILAFGTSLSPFSTVWGYLFGERPVIQVSVDALANIANNRKATLHIQADVNDTVQAILDRLKASTFTQEGFRTPQTVELMSGDLLQTDFSENPAVSDGRLDPRLAVREIDRHLPDDCIVLVGAGHYQYFPTTFLSAKQREFHFAHDFGAIGQALPTAMGIAVANPDRPVVMFEGDASLLMHIQELETMARHRISLLMVVINDGALGAEYHSLKGKGFEPDLATFGSCDYGSVAKAFGLRGVKVSATSELGAPIDDYFRTRESMIVDVPVTRSVISRMFRMYPD